VLGVVRRGVQTKTAIRAAVWAALLSLSLGGCAGGLAGLSTPPTAYNLLAAAGFAHASGHARGQLIVAEPVALSVLDSEKIVVRPVPGEIAALGGAQWQDRLPKLVQARLLQSFENDGRLRAVALPADKVAADFQLVTDIRAFELSVVDGSAVVEIAAKIVRENSGRIAAARVFRATVPAAGTDAPSAVAALNEAFAKVATQMVLWAAKVS
jgi:cholesterol transport system auxiliary component